MGSWAEQAERSEAEPLLASTATGDRCIIITEELESDIGSSRWASELRRLLHLALPTAATGVLAYTSRLITTSQVGWLSSRSLSSLALGQTVYNITGLSLVVGISSGITTFVGHAHGAAESSLKGLILQRGAAVALLTAVMPLIGWTQVAGLLRLLGQQDVIADGAASYIHLASPALLLSALNFCLMDYLSAQSVVRPLVLVTFTSMTLTPLLNHLFIHVVGWGFLGTAATLVVLQGIELLILVTIAVWHNARQPPGLRPWSGFSSAALAAFGPYLAVAIPSCAQICLDWWAFEALTLLAGLLPNAETAVAAIGICFGLHVVIFLVIDGVSVAVSVRVANELGAGRSAAARDAVLAGVGLGMATTLACITPVQLLPHRVAHLFSNDPKVVSIIMGCLPGLLLSLIGDSVNSVLSGCIKGAGKQALGALVNFFAFWCFGLPLAGFMALRWGLGAPGLWWAMAVTSTVQAVALACVICCMDWQAESVRSKQLVRSQEGSLAAPLLLSPTGTEGGAAAAVVATAAAAAAAEAEAATECTPSAASPG